MKNFYIIAGVEGEGASSIIYIPAFIYIPASRDKPGMGRVA
jgi:hypothetical protein